jgi:hypothetical protein
MVAMDIITTLIEATATMNIMLMHRSTLNLGIITLLVTHPLLKMSATTSLRTAANALVHLILIIRISTMMKDLIGHPDVIRALVEVYRMMKVTVTDVAHLDLPLERRCSELLLLIRIIICCSGSMTTTIIRGVHLKDVMKHHLDKIE